MKTSLFMCTYNRDFEYLRYCLKSIEKFARGFHSLVILVPKQDLEELAQLVSEFKPDMTITCAGGEEWEGKGFLWHMYQVMHADKWCPDSDFIGHLDPDCVFTGRVKPETFIVNGKPILRFEHFDTIGVRHPGVLCWRYAAEKALPFGVDREFMRGHPEVYSRENYAEARTLIEIKTRQSLEDYIKSCRNEHPQTFAEYPTLGAVAFHCFKEKYHLHDCALQENPDFQPFPIFQAWSHSPPENACDLWYKGKMTRLVPMEIYKSIGIA